VGKGSPNSTPLGALAPLHPPERVIVAITGASGSVYGVRLLSLLREIGRFEVHLVVSKAGVATMRHELGHGAEVPSGQADVTHGVAAIGSSIASGSFPVRAMFVAPCSMKTLSAIATCHSTDLIGRAADVTLKEGRPLLLLVRETPLHLGHLRLMTSAAEMGAVIMPPVPAFYAHPRSVEDIVEYTVRRMVERAGLVSSAVSPWLGLGHELQPEAPAHVRAGQEAGQDAVVRGREASRS